jgi:thioredoxin-like negative regulator of GroEL
MADEIKKYLDERNQQPCIIMLTGKNCIPCDNIKPKYLKYSTKNKEIAFLKPIDVDDINTPECREKIGFRVKSLPVFAGYVGGECITHFVGADEKQLERMVEVMIKEASASKNMKKFRINT